jgi:hypothetical protein
MTVAGRRRASYEDPLAVPAPLIAEIINGELHTQPRPADVHTSGGVYGVGAADALVADDRHRRMVVAP